MVTNETCAAKHRAERWMIGGLAGLLVVALATDVGGLAASLLTRRAVYESEARMTERIHSLDTAISNHEAAGDVIEAEFRESLKRIEDNFKGQHTTSGTLAKVK